MTKPKIKKLKLPCPVIECWAVKFRDGWFVASVNYPGAVWRIGDRKIVKGTFIPHKEGRHG